MVLNTALKPISTRAAAVPNAREVADRAEGVDMPPNSGRSSRKPSDISDEMDVFAIALVRADAHATCGDLDAWHDES